MRKDNQVQYKFSFCFYIHYIRFGVCCLFITSTSGSTSNQNCSYIQNPNFPNAYGVTTAISFTVAKCSSGMYLSFLAYKNGLGKHFQI